MLVEPGRRLLRVMLSSTMHSLPLMATDLGYSLCRMHGRLQTHIMCMCSLQPRAYTASNDQKQKTQDLTICTARTA